MSKFKIGDRVRITDVSHEMHGAEAIVSAEGKWQFEDEVTLKINGSPEEWYAKTAFVELILPAPLDFESVCGEADRLVSTDRGNSYGHPLDDFGKVTGMALALWGRGPQTEEEHAIYMMLVKIAREANKHKRDNLVDVCGYAKTLEMVIFEREKRAMIADA